MLFLLPSDQVLPLATNLEKIFTYLQLWRLGCPILRSAILTEKEDINDANINQIIEHLNSSRCLMRFQYKAPCNSPIRGGNIVEITTENFQSFWDNDRILWPMMPVDRLTNRYGVNIAYIPFEKRITFEIVGRGFDVSDINRGDISPHQVIKLPRPDCGDSKVTLNYANYVVEENEYKESQLRRKSKLEKMGVDVSGLVFDPVFKPISSELLSILNEYAQRVLRFYGYRELVISCTVAEGGGVVFWDIQTPGGKYEALHEETNIGIGK